MQEMWGQQQGAASTAAVKPEVITKPEVQRKTGNAGFQIFTEPEPVKPVAATKQFEIFQDLDKENFQPKPKPMIRVTVPDELPEPVSVPNPEPEKPRQKSGKVQAAKTIPFQVHQDSDDSDNSDNEEEINHKTMFIPRYAVHLQCF
jgi:hypothetical protein